MKNSTTIGTGFNSKQIDYSLVSPAIIALSLFKIVMCIAIAVALNGCGKDEDKSGSVAETKNDKKTPYALAKNKLPACNDDNESQLVYHTGEKQFYTCEAGDWVEINMDLPERNEETESVLQGTFWLDKKTGTRWFLNGFTAYSALCNARAVGDTAKENYLRHPTIDQVREVLRNGIFDGFNLPVWTDHDAKKVVYSNYPSTDLDSRVGATAMRLCIVAE